MINAPHLPRSLAFLIAQGVAAAGPGGAAISIQNVIPEIATWDFPQALPPVQLIAILYGGQPGRVYTPSIRVVGPPANAVLAEARTSDTPFTTQIERVNLLVGLQTISADSIVTEPGIYTFELVIDGQVIARTPLKIHRVSQPPNIVIPPQG